jgi:hypothetical protein
VNESIEEQSRRMFERRMLMNYNLDEEKLRRLGVFFLIHSHVDIKLIALVVKAETEKLSMTRPLSLDDHALLSLKWSRGTFTRHLREAQARNLLDPDEVQFAEEINRARDSFVHFEVGRFQLPHYCGKDVTGDGGYRAFLLAAMTFDVNVPFPHF